MNALANQEVGAFLNEHFVSSFQKVATFRIVNGEKQGGNVASYFCTPEGRVLHVVVGPVAGAKLLEEARWVEETWKLAQMHEVKTVGQLQSLFRVAHLERLAKDFNIKLNARQLPPQESGSTTAAIKGAYVNGILNRSADQQGKVHLLLAVFPAGDQGWASGSP